jgi:hypothetical protein
MLELKPVAEVAQLPSTNYAFVVCVYLAGSLLFPNREQDWAMDDATTYQPQPSQIPHDDKRNRG